MLIIMMIYLNQFPPYCKYCYTQIIQKVATCSVDVRGWGYFGNVLDFNAVHQYSYALKEIMQVQRYRGINHIRKQDLDSDRMAHHMKPVKGRKNNVTKAMFKERTTRAFQPFKMIQEIISYREVSMGIPFKRIIIWCICNA